ncbi:MAG: nitrile hydratase accessory protein [Candidatus Rokuibacteriota bacterium]|nr:MAG: nitrile hydratase accessory protein [Candidatus Rokubacteria bacterium]
MRSTSIASNRTWSRRRESGAGLVSAARADLDVLPAIPRDAEGPVFRAPWEAQAFAMAVMLHERGHFTWKEWANRLAGEIAAAKTGGEPDDDAARPADRAAQYARLTAVALSEKLPL